MEDNMGRRSMWGGKRRSFAEQKPPLIKRTRSWRGVMQARFDDTRTDSSKIVKHAFVFAPIRVFGITLMSVSSLYIGMGHDSFMYHVLGYESETAFEARVNPMASGTSHSTPMLKVDDQILSPVYDLEKGHERSNDQQFALFRQGTKAAEEVAKKLGS